MSNAITINPVRTGVPRMADGEIILPSAISSPIPLEIRCVSAVPDLLGVLLLTEFTADPFFWSFSPASYRLGQGGVASRSRWRSNGVKGRRGFRVL